MFQLGVQQRIQNAIGVLVLIALASCGAERTTSESMVGLMSGLQSSSSTASSSTVSSINSQLNSGHGNETLKMQINRIGQEVLMSRHAESPRFRPSSLSLCDSFETSIQNDLGSSCSVSSCSGDLTSSLSFAINCTQISDSVSCGCSSYTLSDFAYTATMSYTVSGSTYNFSYDMDMNGVVDGGGLSGAVDCSVGFDFSYDSSTASYGAPTMDCDDQNFSCSIGGIAVTCADLQTGSGEFSCK